MSALDLILTIVMWAMVAFCVFAGGAIAFCWMLFGIAKWKGWLTEETTPLDVLERLTNASQGGKDGVA